MEANNGIDSKPRVRGRGRRRLSDRTSALSTEHPDDPLEDTGAIFADVEQVLNVRVKERDNDAGRRSRLGNLFKEPASTAIKGLFNKEPAQELKETIKRPLTGLFRRPGSRAGSVNAPHKGVSADGGNANMEVLASNYLQGSSPSSLFPDYGRLVYAWTGLRLVQESVAHAPNVSVNRVAAMYQLDALNAKNAFLAKLDDIDLSLLSRYLCSEEEVRDEKVAWTWDYVFASISTEMREEWALDEEQDDDNYDERNRNNRFSH
ncbi:unnamed protein product [Toxocara canis]|uniref:Ypt/Rab-GAP domain of gyp1p superfamily protein n=1 Tax=Toxocara canis TaxID=6265 RepID=A0A183URI7_TOXCA|nr:unnamed protein product [Toxocara canis]